MQRRMNKERHEKPLFWKKALIPCEKKGVNEVPLGILSYVLNNGENSPHRGFGYKATCTTNVPRISQLSTSTALLKLYTAQVSSLQPRVHLNIIILSNIPPLNIGSIGV
jgi:hypothetical protein